MVRLNKTVDKSTINEQGGLGFTRTPKRELFITAISTLNEDTFYESASQRRNRIAELVKLQARDVEGLTNLVRFLRNELALRTVPAMIAVETVRARLDLGLTGGNRQIIDASIGRLSETADVIAYYHAHYGRSLPSAVKRGVNDALSRTLNETSWLKWRGRTSAGAVSLRDVINLTHYEGGALGKAVIDFEYGNEVDYSKLPIVRARQDWVSNPIVTPETVDSARLTHEVIAGVKGTLTPEDWAVLVPKMGYKALRMNLRRIHQSGVSDEVIDVINERLQSPTPDTLPLDYISAVRNAPLDFASALQRAANKVLDNVPELGGKTLILVDRSASMGAMLSERSTLRYQDAANLFAASLAIRAEDADVYSFNTSTVKVDIKGRDLLRIAESLPGFSGGTDTVTAVARTYRDGYDRVIILTDEQSGSYWGDPLKPIPAHVPVYTWNLAGYRAAHSDNKPNRYWFGGLSDKAFGLIPLIESGFEE